MERNVGSVDRVLRIVLGAVLIVVPMLGLSGAWADGWMGYASMAVGLILALTALIGFCPLYTILGIRTCQKG